MWRTIETAPKDGSGFLACNGQWMTVCHWHRQQQCWASNGPVYSPYPADEQPTHWAPLPKAPDEMEKAIEIPMDNCGLSINCGRDGTWLHFTASNGHHASINVDLMDNGSSITKSALRGWCADRQEQAKNLQPVKNVAESYPDGPGYIDANGRRVHDAITG
jgi:hypothetical protein